jgi:hypothetical protein
VADHVRSRMHGVGVRIMARRRQPREGQCECLAAYARLALTPTGPSYRAAR